MAAPRPSYPHRYPDAAGQLRLRLAPVQAGAQAGGIWHPYGRELAREGAHLIDAFPEDRGRVDRFVHVPADWADAADHIFTRHGRVKVGTLPDDQRGTVLLRLHTFEVVRLRVSWPDDPKGPPTHS